MRIFVTGATGFIGSRVVRELLAGKHQVLGLTRSKEGAEQLIAAGATPHEGSLDNLDSLRAGAASTDAVIHLAFIHDFSRFIENCAIDRLAIETLGAVLAGSERPLIVTGGLAGLGRRGAIVTEDMAIAPDSPLPRVSEQTAMALLSKGVRASVMRLPQVHDTVKQGLVTYLIAHAREKQASAFVGSGENRWAAAHVDDVARLYRLALEHNQPGKRYHAVAEQGVMMKDIAKAIGQGLKLPVISVDPAQSAQHFGWLDMFASNDLVGSGQQTQKDLGWSPTGPGLIEDLENMHFGS